MYYVCYIKVFELYDAASLKSLYSTFVFTKKVSSCLSKFAEQVEDVKRLFHYLCDYLEEDKISEFIINSTIFKDDMELKHADKPEVTFVGSSAIFGLKGYYTRLFYAPSTHSQSFVSFRVFKI